MSEPDYRQQQENEELEQRAVLALQQMYHGQATEDDVRLVAWLTGFTTIDIKGERNGSVRK
jgi:hypothetical protein